MPPRAECRAFRNQDKKSTPSPGKEGKEGHVRAGRQYDNPNHMLVGLTPRSRFPPASWATPSHPLGGLLYLAIKRWHSSKSSSLIQVGPSILISIPNLITHQKPLLNFPSKSLLSQNNVFKHKSDALSLLKKPSLAPHCCQVPYSVIYSVI